MSPRPESASEAAASRKSSKAAASRKGNDGDREVLLSEDPNSRFLPVEKEDAVEESRNVKKGPQT